MKYTFNVITKDVRAGMLYYEIYKPFQKFWLNLNSEKLSVIVPPQNGCSVTIPLKHLFILSMSKSSKLLDWS